MRTIMVAAIAAAGAALAEVKPLTTDGRGWFGDPLTWTFHADGVSCVRTNGCRGLAVYQAAPLASNVTVEAVFTPRCAERVGWSIAGVAVVEDARNYWHLALVQSPPEDGCRPKVELVEMRDGVWLSQSNLKMEASEEPGAQWVFGQPVRLSLSLEPSGVSGSILTTDGTVLLRRRFAFTALAVTRGRPALHIGGFTGAFTSINAAWSLPVAEAKEKPAFLPYDMKNNAPQVTDRASGFFRAVQKPDGRWWAIDPNGGGVVLLGVDHVTFHGHWCEKLGYCPHGRKNEKKYANRAEWERETLGRLKKWGFNMLGAGCDPALRRRGLVHTEFLDIGSHLATLGDEYDITPNEQRPCSAFPNVFHPDFEAYCRYRAQVVCAPNRDDPWLFGTFIDNELAWWGRGAHETGLFDAVMKKGPSHTAKIALRDFVAGRYGGHIEAFNTTFGTALADFTALLELNALPGSTDEQRAVKHAFLRHTAERYFSVASAAIREADPNHLVLGARFAGTGGADPVVWEVSGKYCDVVTFNCYPMADLDEGRVYTHFGRGGEPVTEHFAKYYGYVKRPMLITEWSFPALDAGLPSVHGAGQRFRTQAERTLATSLFARTMLSLPFLLGYDYFMWVDEPALGISTPFPEDSNYGLINEDGEPYAELTAMFEALQREAGGWRFKPAPQPLARPPRGPRPDAMTVARRGARGGPANFAREGDAFRAANGRIELAGRLGEGYLVSRVTLDGGSAFGSYNALLHTLDAGGRDRWTDTHALTRVEGRIEDGVAVLELTGSHAAGREGFEVMHRLLLPPGAPWFVCEFASVKNTGSEPLCLKSIFFRPYGAFKDLPRDMPPNVWGAPVSDCWMDGADGRFYGAVAAKGSGILIDFWLNPQGGQHADARWELEREVVLAPGEVFTPPEPVYLVVTAGTGGRAGWLEAARQTGSLFE